MNQTLNDIQYEPVIHLADNCPAITKGYVKCFEKIPDRRIVCWAHAIRNWDGKFKFFTEPELSLSDWTEAYQWSLKIIKNFMYKKAGKFTRDK